jgi:membrane-associated HD superfamily phosphohydrolase
MFQLNSNKLGLTTLGATLIIIGVVLKNTFEQLGFPNHSIAKPLGMLAFVGGWALIAYSVSIDTNGNFKMNNKTLMIIGSCITIVLAVMMMKSYMVSKQSPPMIFPIIFASAWLLLGYLTGKTKGIIASIMVLVSMMISLPWQRKNNIVDGPGLPLFVGAWALIAFINSVE